MYIWEKQPPISSQLSPLLSTILSIFNHQLPPPTISAITIIIDIHHHCEPLMSVANTPITFIIIIYIHCYHFFITIAATSTTTMIDPHCQIPLFLQLALSSTTTNTSPTTTDSSVTSINTTDY